MKEAAEKHYHVVHFTSALPYASCNRFHFIPRTWIKDYYEWMSANEAIAVIYYPDQPVKNMWILKKLKKHQASWKEFIVDVVYSSDDFEAAKKKLKWARKGNYQPKQIPDSISELMNMGKLVASPSSDSSSHERTSSKLILKLPNQPRKEFKPPMKNIDPVTKQRLIKEIITKTAKVLINRVDVDQIPTRTESDMSVDDSDILEKLDLLEVIFEDAKKSLFKMKGELDEQAKLARIISEYLKTIEQ
ncbi:uncharacterized protein LOC125239378 [Leguminivora glycinivorella]|uniref:uncharacterized protein LOC125239378 n=1 Tax=Leguminivora glycinivorella TaxID=1035111 RepID=UPI0020104559|nr:uncharacterized protein LOC125239378 [Leguminivora glycinivorella]XP_048002900.1 uncharacterized protein LOC125239378 [Leguminivora glycinivorella]